MKYPFPRSFLMTVCIFATLVSATSFASVVGGVYVTTGESHYQNGEITVTPWGTDSFTMTAKLVDGERLYETEAFLEPQGNGRYQGSGVITVRYSDNTGCRHRFGIIADIDGESIWLRENTPQNIPYDPNGPCTAAGPYIWFNHEAPYVLQGEK